MGNLRIRFLVLAWSLVAASPTAAQTLDYAARQRIEAAVAGLGTPHLGMPDLADTYRQDADRLMAGLGLSVADYNRPVAVAAPDFVSTGTANVELVDLRLLLTQIAVQTGARDHQALVRAQGDRAHKVILLRGGFVTLQELVSLSRGTPAADFIDVVAGRIVLTRPLAIWSDAGLHLAADDRLVFDRPSGSFLANLGWLDVAGAAVTGTADANLSEPKFRPFLLTAGAGSLTARDATLQGLGFGDTVVFGGISIVNNGLSMPVRASQVEDSRLIGITTLSLLGTQGVVVAGNHLSGSVGTAILVSRSRGAVIAGNTLQDLSGPQAIRITAASRDIAITDNVLAGGARTGIQIDDESTGITVAGNIILDQATTGLSVQSGTCIAVAANLVAASGGSGISLQDTGAVTLSGNAILFNDGAAVLIRDQTPEARVRVSGNVVIGNREGLRGATPGVVALEGNDLDGQLPRLFVGDLAPLMVGWLRDRRVGTVASAIPVIPMPCDDGGQG